MSGDFHRLGDSPYFLRFEIKGRALNACWGPKAPTPAELGGLRDLVITARNAFLSGLAEHVDLVVLERPKPAAGMHPDEAKFRAVVGAIHKLALPPREALARAGFSTTVIDAPDAGAFLMARGNAHAEGKP